MFEKLKYKRALRSLQRQGIGEGDFGESHEVPADLIELSEVLEWEAEIKGDEQYRREQKLDPT